MSEVKKRKVHTPEFKAKVGLEALRGAKTINEIGQEYGVHPAQVGQWKKEIQEHAKTLFEGKRGPGAIAVYIDVVGHLVLPFRRPQDSRTRYVGTVPATATHPDGDDLPVPAGAPGGVSRRRVPGASRRVAPGAHPSSRRR